MSRRLSNIAYSTFFAGVFSTVASAVAAPPFTVIAVTDEQAPGLVQGVTFAALNRATIDENGNVAFSVEYTTGSGGVNANNNVGLWSNRSGMFVQEAREGQQAVGLPNMITYKSFVVPILNRDGDIAFEAILQGPGVTTVNDEAIFSDGTGNALGLVAREGDAAPGVGAGINHSGIARVVFNDDDRIMFSGDLVGSGIDLTNSASIWSGFNSPGTYSLVVRESNQAPDLPAGVLLSTTAAIEPVLGGDNLCAFRFALTGTGVNTDNDNCIFSGPANALEALREGGAAPGTDGAFFANFLQPAINLDGDVTFDCFLVGPNVDGTNDRAIFSTGQSGVLELVAREGEASPIAGATFDGFFKVLISDDDTTSFTATLEGDDIGGDNDEAIFANHGGDLAVVAREGQQVPGLADGVVFGGPANAFSNLTANGRGQLMFTANITGPGVVSSNDQVIVQFDPLIGLKVVLRKGESIEVAPGDERVVMTFILSAGSGGSDGKQSSFNDVGQLAIWIWFDDMSEAVIVTDDTDGDGTADIFDSCPNTVNADQADDDGDGVGNACDDCPNDPNKTSPGACGCGTSDADSDGDGTPDCFDNCPNDADKIAPGACGCGTSDVDTDGDLIPDCNDSDPSAPNPNQPAPNTGGDDDDDMMTPSTEECCGGGMPAMMPFMLLGWRGARRRRRSRR